MNPTLQLDKPITNPWAEIHDWIIKELQYPWRKKVAEVILDHPEPMGLINDDEFINEIVSLLKDPEFRYSPNLPPLATEQQAGKVLKLLSLGPVCGVDKLNTSKPLEFPKDKQLVVVYGQNGSGKSSYTRLLKAIAGKSTDGVKNNVYSPREKRECAISFQVEGAEKEDKTWTPASLLEPIKELISIDIFDSKVGEKDYFDKKTACSYTPEVLKFFEYLCKVLDKIKNKLNEEKSQFIRSNFIEPPANYQNTNHIKKLKTCLNSLSPIESFDWDEEIDGLALKTLQSRLEKDPNQAKREAESQVKELNKIINDVEPIIEKLSFNALNEIKRLKDKDIELRALADQEDLSEDETLGGLNTNNWRTLWEAARNYSTKEAYKETAFPNIAEKAQCVLCHQELSEPAKIRLTRFENFIKADLATQADNAKTCYDKAIQKLPTIKPLQEVPTMCAAARLSDDWVEYFKGFLTKATDLKNLAFNYSKDNYCFISGMESYPDCIGSLTGELNRLNASIIDLTGDIENFNSAKIKIEAEILELKAKKWIADNKQMIENEFNRRQTLKQYDDHWMKQCQTRLITNKSDELAEKIITEAYKKRFEEELDSLCGFHKITVEINKDKASQGSRQHKIQLISANNNDVKILSEGEQKIVQLSAFLADTSVNQNKAPFIFDDPISSLDHIFEEKVADRLVALSQTRQVIVFTHRLSLLELLVKDKSKSIVVSLWEESTGEPCEIDLYGKKPKAILETLLIMLNKAKKHKESNEILAYRSEMQSIRSEFRKVLERMIETNLLNDVVIRHRRDITTKNKIGHLHHITQVDCDLFDSLMTKYSTPLHSTTTEQSKNPINDEELRVDVISMQEWLKSFSDRQKPLSVS